MIAPAIFKLVRVGEKFNNVLIYSRGFLHAGPNAICIERKGSKGEHGKLSGVEIVAPVAYFIRSGVNLNPIGPGKARAPIAVQFVLTAAFSDSFQPISAIRPHITSPSPLNLYTAPTHVLQCVVIVYS